MIAIGLTCAYLVLVGDAIHCQYASVGHAHDGVPQSDETGDSTHCLIVSHGSSTLPAMAPAGGHVLHALQPIRYDDPIVGFSASLASTPSRAPPRL